MATSAIVVALIVVAFASAGMGCKRKTVPSGIDSVTDADGGNSVAEPGGESGPQLPFGIVQIYEGQKPRTAAPWHEAGGGWTFFDAKSSDGIRFGFGFDRAKAVGRMSFGEVMLTVPDRENASRLVTSLAKRFDGKIPPDASAQPLALRPFKAVFLGSDMNRTGSGFSGRGGGYYATKLFLQRPGIEAEVFFNFNLKEKSGAFAEKDHDYANDLVAFVASELRDGPRPKRTPATDPSMTEHGPRIRWIRDLPGTAYGMNPARDRYWMKEDVPGGGMKLIAHGLGEADARKEVLRVPHELYDVQCAGDFCAAVDSVRKNPEYTASGDPTSLFFFDTKSGAGSEVKGPWGSKGSLALGKAIAPRGELFLVQELVPNPKGPLPNKHVLYVVDRTGMAKGPIDLGGGSWEITSIDLSAKASRILVRMGSTYQKDAPISYVSVDPATGNITPAGGPPVAKQHVESSPDGKRSVECTADALVVRDVATGTERRFPVHGDDRRAIADGCVHWASNRYLEYRAGFIGFVDVETMKLNEAFATPEDAAKADTLDFDAMFTRAIGRADHETRVGRITVE